MSIDHINDGDSGLIARTIINEIVDFINNDVNYVGTGSLATTGSNTFYGTQIISSSAGNNAIEITSLNGQGNHFINDTNGGLEIQSAPNNNLVIYSDQGLILGSNDAVYINSVPLRLDTRLEVTGEAIITGSVNITGSLTANTVNVGQNTLNFIDNNGNTLVSLSASGSSLILSTGSIVSSYKTYTALLSQSGSNNPTSIILENTLGNIVWSRTSTGIYDGTLVGAFPISKSFCMIQKDTFISVAPQDESLIKRISNDVIRVSTGGGGFADNILDNTSIEIRVYN